MKNLTRTFLIPVLSLAFFCLPAAAEAQSDGGKKKQTSPPAGSGAHCFNADTRILNVGVGLGPVYYRYNRAFGYSYRGTPALSMSYEQAYPEKVGPGYLGLGVYVGYQGARLRYDDYYYNGNRYYYQHRWNYWVGAARATYHPDVLNFDKAEVYVGVMAGLRFQTYRYVTNSSDPDMNRYRWGGRSLYPSLSILAGARWYFASRTALYAELGYGVSYLTLGLSFKL